MNDKWNAVKQLDDFQYEFVRLLFRVVDLMKHDVNALRLKRWDRWDALNDILPASTLPGLPTSKCSDLYKLLRVYSATPIAVHRAIEVLIQMKNAQTRGGRMSIDC